MTLVSKPAPALPPLLRKVTATSPSLGFSMWKWGSNSTFPLRVLGRTEQHIPWATLNSRFHPESKVVIPAGLGRVRIDYLEASDRGALLNLEGLGKKKKIKKMGAFCQEKENYYSLNKSKGNIIF